MTILMGIDQSTAHSGYAILELVPDSINGFDILATGHRKTPSKITGYLAAQYQGLELAKVAHQWKPGVIAFETLYMPRAANPQTIFLLGHLHGLIFQTMRNLNPVMEFVDVSAGEVSSYMGIGRAGRVIKKRAARQTAAIFLLGDRTRFQEIDENEADSLLIGIVGAGKYNLAQAAAISEIDPKSV